mgnify:CR=1 FL=1
MWIFGQNNDFSCCKECRRQNTIIMHASMYLCSPGDASNKIPLTGVQLIFYRRKEGRSWQVESPAGVIKNTNILWYLDTQVSLCGTQYMDIMELKQTAADGREDTHVCTYVEIKGFKRFGQLAETSCAMRCKTDKIIMSNNLYHP